MRDADAASQLAGRADKSDLKVLPSLAAAHSALEPAAVALAATASRYKPGVVRDEQFDGRHPKMRLTRIRRRGRYVNSV